MGLYNIKMKKNNNKTKSKMEQMAHWFDVELDEEFDILCPVGEDRIAGCPYKFTRFGLVNCDDSYHDVALTLILTDKLKVTKILWKPKSGDTVYYKELDGSISEYVFSEKCIDSLVAYQTGYIFKTKQEAEESDSQKFEDFYKNR